MRILGIELTTPTVKDLLLGAAIVLIPSVLIGIVAEISLPVLVGMTSGVLAASYGISISKHGWRGLVLIIGSSVLMLTLVSVFDQLFHG